MLKMIKHFFAWLLAIPERNIKHEFKCGHRSPRRVKMTVFGVRVESDLQKKNDEYCPTCLAKMAIQCAWCGRPIFPDQPVTGYVLTEEKKASDFKIPPHAFFYTDNQPLGGRCCAEMFCDCIGTWKAPGYVDTKEVPYKIVRS
ncbi:MAG: hypothetical protein RJA61_682 [Candidatus Parcubacteria bacterium]|jgi:hypothetical protein